MDPNDDFLKTKLNYAVVIRTDIKTIEDIKKFISERPDLAVIYQVIDGGHLWIMRGSERGTRP